MLGLLNVKLGVLLSITLKFSSYLMENTCIACTPASLATLLGEIVVVSVQIQTDIQMHSVRKIAVTSYVKAREYIQSPLRFRRQFSVVEFFVLSFMNFE